MSKSKTLFDYRTWIQFHSETGLRFINCIELFAEFETGFTMKPKADTLILPPPYDCDNLDAGAGYNEFDDERYQSYRPSAANYAWPTVLPPGDYYHDPDATGYRGMDSRGPPGSQQCRISGSGRTSEPIRSSDHHSCHRRYSAVRDHSFLIAVKPHGSNSTGSICCRFALGLQLVVYTSND